MISVVNYMVSFECIKIAPSDGVYPPRVLHGGVFGGTPLGSPEMYIFARARMGVCTESCQFVVPLGPAPPPPVRTRAESAPKNGTWNFGNKKNYNKLLLFTTLFKSIL